ncbi:hypothetical protein WA026_023844 [Henosepilachna vigintioctopunctata]|uniref:Fibrinogen C-terminal domain-containing protein n=1 Tax=Henosepilachna vigintioctopunctata TaxID=420089 RepID=A0AAW1V4L9_9CUCU
MYERSDGSQSVPRVKSSRAVATKLYLVPGSVSEVSQGNQVNQPSVRRKRCAAFGWREVHSIPVDLKYAVLLRQLSCIGRWGSLAEETERIKRHLAINWVIQRRDDFGDPRENFNRDWNDYKNGFGDPAKEFWLGNENIYMLTNNEEYILRVELEDFEGNKRYAQYSHFKIYSEGDYYKLEIDGYEGTAGDSLNDPWYGSNNSPFSTYNRDNDRSSLNCASMLKGGWWWKSCGRGLNGLYLNDPQDLTARQGIVWFKWRGWDYTLKKSEMMIKPKGSVSSSNK